MSLNVSGYNISDIYIGDDKIDKIFVGDDLVYTGKKITPLCFASENPSVVSTIEFEAVEYSSNATTSSTAHPVTIAALDASKYSNYAAPSWVYSYDLDNWNNYTLGTAISIGDNYPSEVYFKCTANYDASVNTFVTSYLDAENNKVYWSAMHCVMTGGNICASGSINSLIYVDYEDEDNNNNAFSHIFACMFKGCQQLITPPELPATTLAPYCYNSMFKNCTSLTTPPKLPATTLAGNCYTYMFDGCTSLDAIPELPATTLADYCYQSMFANDAVRASGGISDPCTYMYRIPTAGTGSGGTKSLSTMFTSASGDSTYTPTINSVLYVNKPVIYLKE